MKRPRRLYGRSSPPAVAARKTDPGQSWCPYCGSLARGTRKERADAIFKQELARLVESAVSARRGRTGVPAACRRKWASMLPPWAKSTVPEVTVEMHRLDRDALEFDVSYQTHCRFAEFFFLSCRLDGPELGALLILRDRFRIIVCGGGGGSESSLTSRPDRCRAHELHYLRYKGSSVLAAESMKAGPPLTQKGRGGPRVRELSARQASHAHCRRAAGTIDRVCCAITWRRPMHDPVPSPGRRPRSATRSAL